MTSHIFPFGRIFATGIYNQIQFFNMDKKTLYNNLRTVIGHNYSNVALNLYFRCFAEHARYLARFYSLDESLIRPPAQLRYAHALNDCETELFCIYWGYNLRLDKPTPLW